MNNSKYVKYRTRRIGQGEVLNSETLLWVKVSEALADEPELNFLKLPTDGICWGNDAPMSGTLNDLEAVNTESLENEDLPESYGYNVPAEKDDQKDYEDI